MRCGIASTGMKTTFGNKLPEQNYTVLERITLNEIEPQ
jgi:hypothetical protein